jgi:L-threonylcarbamoyladenylate synthase
VELVDGSVTVLRPGGITAEAIAAVLGHEVTSDTSGPARAPGMLASHYSPDARVEMCEAQEAAERVAGHLATGARVGLLSIAAIDVPGATTSWDAGGDAAAFARSLYRWLRQADTERLDVLVVVPPPDEGIGVAVRDRLRRAAHR